jgi:HSP20 family protein
VKVIFARNTIVVVGQKLPAACEDRHATFHLAERAFGRFARGVRLTGAFDAGRADATLRDGVLRVTLPRIEERRGGERRIHVRGGD